MKDRLTPRERFGLLVIDEPQDRVSIFPLITSHAARVLGASIRDYVTSGAVMAQAQLAAQDRYGHDFISLFSEVGIIAEALGSEFSFPEDDLPIIERPRWRELPEESDLSDVPELSDTGRLRVYLDAINLAYESRGDTVPILAYVPAPFTTCQHLVETEAFLLGLMLEPERVHRLLQYATRSVIAFSRSCINAGALPILVDPLASASVVSPDQFRDFCLPYEKEVISYWHRYDLDVVLHICGDTAPITELMVESGADLLSVDRVDLASVVAKVGDKVRIIGNFNTSEIWLGDPAGIEKKAVEMTRTGLACPKGYVAATGCEVPLATQGENVDAFIRGCRSG